MYSLHLVKPGFSPVPEMPKKLRRLAVYLPPMQPVCLSLLLALASTSLPATETRNVVVILTDDQGYQDLGCFGSPRIRTPNLDRMAKEGRRFTNLMVPSPVCTPSRAGLLTGCYPKRVGLHRGVLFPTSRHGLHPDEFTLAELFGSRGYATACIGKWHLGHFPEVLPRAQGFDSYFGIPYSNDMNHPDNVNKTTLRRDASWNDLPEAARRWRTPLVRDEAIAEFRVDQRTITRRYTDEAIRFVTENRDRPFFLYLPHSMPHVPLFVPEDAYDPDPRNAYKCVIEHLDAEVGRLVDTLRREGLAGKTLVIFTSDNGPWLPFGNHGGSAKPLRGGKGTTFEGGMRVPCVMWAPGLVPAGSECGDLMSTIDLLPTLAALHDWELPERPIDGIDASGRITGKAGSAREEFLYYTSQGEPDAIRVGPWKLLAATTKRPAPLLYNLEEDVGERHDRAAERPELVARLRDRLAERDQELGSEARPTWKATAPHPWPDNPPTH